MATIRLEASEAEATLVAERLHQEGVMANVVADMDSFPVSGMPLRYSLVVPEDQVEKARHILDGTQTSGKRRKHRRG